MKIDVFFPHSQGLQQVGTPLPPPPTSKKNLLATGLRQALTRPCPNNPKLSNNYTILNFTSEAPCTGIERWHDTAF